MKTSLFSMFVMLLIAGTLPVTVFAHGAHCHKKNADGTISDLPEAKDKKSCEAQGGVWRHHHPHCHKADDLKVDIKDAKDEKACIAKGGKWMDHGHEADGEAK